MDKEKFIKRAKECGYTNEMIEKEIKEYEEDVKKGRAFLDPTDYLFEIPTGVPCSPKKNK